MLSFFQTIGTLPGVGFMVIYPFNEKMSFYRVAVKVL